MARLNNCRFNPTAGALTDWTYSSVVAGYNDPVTAGAVTATPYEYFAISANLADFEGGKGVCTITGGVPTFARTTILFNSLGTTAKINFSAAPQVAIVVLKDDLLSVDEANAFTTTQQGQARKNIAAVGVVKVQQFTASGTYTPDPNLIFAVIECQGPGGGGGGVAGSVGTLRSGAGGGSGAYGRTVASAATVGASQTVTVGTGGAGGASGNNNGTAGSGATSVGTLCTAPAGGGGGGSGGGVATGGTAGAGGTGDFVIAGGTGQSGPLAGVTTLFIQPGRGADSFFGRGGEGTSGSSSVSAGVGGNGYGSGGSGGSAHNIASNTTGGAGQPGAVVITEYCSK